MREIKFRIWFEVEKNMDYDPSTDDSLLNANFGSHFGEVVMQYTGLKDKNGVEIYEGDILSMAGTITGAEGLNPGFVLDDDDKVEVAWDDDIAAWSVAGKLDRTDRVEVTYRNHVVQLIHQGACEVIGNIHENPELLTPTQEKK